MKVLYIYSGYGGIYSYLEEWIIEAFKEKKFEIITVLSSASVKEVIEISKNHSLSFVFTLMGANINKLLLEFLEKWKVPFFIWLTEDPFYIDKSLRVINDKNVILTIDFGAYEFYNSRGYKNIFYLPLGTNPSVFKKKEPDEYYKSDILILGYPYPSRVNLAKLILENTNYKLTLVGKGWRNQIPKNLQRLKYLCIIDKWVSPLLATSFYNGAKIVINHHRETNFIHNQNSLHIQSKSINNRTFDISSCGAFQLIDYKEDLYNQYEGDEVIHYRTLTECINKINSYINEEDLRKMIANKARLRALSNHTWNLRVDTIMDIIKRYTTL
ncbi:CgeB family protein [Priestia megaterium]|uniref:CgeB family protein n=1 Tax=Priestia megaterium TaxID=1404 RepID=UPI002862D170|nr:glycosyltransferase [Priestia megaterium]MDR7246584.1 spore maturation protein CgeB [Priestia megaterium]